MYLLGNIREIDKTLNNIYSIRGCTNGRSIISENTYSLDYTSFKFVFFITHYVVIPMPSFQAQILGIKKKLKSIINTVDFGWYLNVLCLSDF